MLSLTLQYLLKYFYFLSVAECNIQTSPSPGIQVRHVYTPSTTKHFSPIKQSTTLTNKHRGNEVSSTPLLVHCKPTTFLFRTHVIKHTLEMSLFPAYFFHECFLCGTKFIFPIFYFWQKMYVNAPKFYYRYIHVSGGLRSL